MGEGGTHGAGAGLAGVASVAEVPLGAPEAGTLGVEEQGGVLMMIVELEAKDETEESGSSAVQTSAIELCSDISAREKGELSLDSLGASSRGGVSEILQGFHLGGDDRSVAQNGASPRGSANRLGCSWA